MILNDIYFIVLIIPEIACFRLLFHEKETALSFFRYILRLMLWEIQHRQVVNRVMGKRRKMLPPNNSRNRLWLAAFSFLHALLECFARDGKKKFKWITLVILGLIHVIITFKFFYF